MKFIALPVGQGDAFYAETDDGFRVLVDGGRSKEALPSLFREYTKSRGVDVLVCTHNDADHAKGVIGFLKSGLDCKELWLPATWIDALTNVPHDVRETWRFLWERFTAIDPERLPAEEGDPQEAAWQTVFPELREKQRESGPEETFVGVGREGARDATVNDLLGDTLDAIDKHLEMLSVLGVWPCVWPWRIPRYGYRRTFLLSVVLKDVRRLLEVARLAMHRGIPIRCFRHDPYNAAPVNGYPLVPLSGKLEAYIPGVRKVFVPKAENFFALAYLTVVNKESLVFYLEAAGDQPGVLFTADSDLKAVNLGRVREGSIVTAPHHGSKDNARVYSMFSSPMVWVRSDGYSRVRPCEEYLSALGQRFCTLCRNSNRKKQAVRFYTRKGRWVRYLTVPCSCT